MTTTATLLMAIAAIIMEALHRRQRCGLPVNPFAAVTALRIALVAAGIAMPAILLAEMKAAGL